MSASTIVVTGGGSGGHITPVLAVANALKQLQPGVQIVYIGQKGDGLGDLPAADPNIDSSRAISAGKLRRYHGEGLKQLLDIRTVALNMRDVLRTMTGIVQAYILLRKYRPSCVFIKGGFVGVPVGLAAALLHIPFVTHDSDAIPGLANRIIARWARYHAVALPKELYSYPAERTVTVGVPTRHEYRLVTAEDQAAYKQQLDLPADAKVLLVTGGGLGAQRLNTALAQVAPQLFAAVPELYIVHMAGRANEAGLRTEYEQRLLAAGRAEQGRVRVLGFSTELYKYGGAADLIVMRAGATAIAEFAVQGKACVLVPNPVLTGGHQLKNAEALAQSGATVVLSDTALTQDLPHVAETIIKLLRDDTERQHLGKGLHEFAHTEAATELAQLILQAAQTQVPTKGQRA